MWRATPGTIDADLLAVRLHYARLVEIDHTWCTRDVRSPYWRYYVNSRSGSAIRIAG